MSTYYEYQDVKIKIAMRLFQLDGWTVYGYHASESDPMTDYYDPAYWGGIAEKNGYKLVIDHKWAEKERRYTVRTSAQAALDAKTAEKLEKLEALTQRRGATAGEEAAARKAIETIRAKMAEAEENAVTVKEVVEPGHMANPPRCNWHIEKDGIIIDKGTGLLKFANVLDITDHRDLKDWQEFNTLTAEAWKAKAAESYVTRWHYTEERAREAAEDGYKSMAAKVKLLEQFNILINRFNTICGGMMGNNDDFYTYEEVTVTEYKTEIKPKETESGSIKEGQHFITKAFFNHGIGKGYVYIIHERTGADGKKWYSANRMNGKNTKELTGNANPANHFGFVDETRFKKWLNNGAVAFCDLVEVKTPYEVKKVVKKKAAAGQQEEQPEEETAAAEEAAAADHAAPEAETAATEGQDATETAAAAETVPETAETVTATEDAETATEEATETAAETAPESEPEADAAADLEGKEESPQAAAPGVNYADLARAYFTGKTVKSCKPNPETATETKQAEKAEEEPEPATAPEPGPAAEAEPEPEPEKPHVYGYSESDNGGMFTDSEIRTMLNGFQVSIVNPRYDWDSACYFCTRYSAYVNLLYRVSAQKNKENKYIPIPGKDAKYVGFLVNGSLYTDMKAIKAKLLEDINKKLLELVPDIHSAAISAANVDDYEKKQIEFYKTLDDTYKKQARELFYRGNKPEIKLYEYHGDYSIDLLIEYIQHPGAVIEKEALAYLCSKAADIYKEWIRYSAVDAEYRAIMADRGREEHTLLKISKSIKDEKTVRVELANGHTVKVEADAVKRLPFCEYISSWYVSAGDRQYVTGGSGKYSDTIVISDIVAIYHGGRVLYKAA